MKGKIVYPADSKSWISHTHNDPMQFFLQVLANEKANNFENIPKDPETIQLPDSSAASSRTPSGVSRSDSKEPRKSGGCCS